jgi:rhamnogalacturonyl hydrolase YesR
VSPAARQPLLAPAQLERVERAIQGLLDELGRHKRHSWSQVGRCVFCDGCGARLYQGSPCTAAEKAELPDTGDCKEGRHG